MLERTIDIRPEADRILTARIHGTAKRHAKWRELTEDEHAAAVGELRELAAGRADLLTHVAGIVEGFSEGQLDEPLAGQAAGLCRAAGADRAAIPGWADEGRRRRASAVLPRLGPAGPRRGRITTMTEIPDMNDVAAAALRLIGAFEHGHSVGALEAVLAADPLVIATALGLLASPVTFTVQCTACGAPVQAEHDPVAAIRPGLHLVSEQPQP